jgi:phosphohistidine phosphatase
MHRRLYLVRHAVAEARGDAWPDDAARPVTADGARRFARAVEGFEALGESIDLILTSPLLRARQTAALLAEGVSSSPHVRVLEELAPGGSAARTVRALAQVRDRVNGIALVGHQPDLGELAAWSLGLRWPLALKKGGICRLDVGAWPPDRDAQFAWLATPKMLRRMT